VGRHREGRAVDAKDLEGESGIGGAAESDHLGNAFVLKKAIMWPVEAGMERGWQTEWLVHSSLWLGRWVVTMLATRNDTGKLEGAYNFCTGYSSAELLSQV